MWKFVCPLCQCLSSWAKQTLVWLAEFSTNSTNNGILGQLYLLLTSLLIYYWLCRLVVAALMYCKFVILLNNPNLLAICCLFFPVTVMERINFFCILIPCIPLLPKPDKLSPRILVKILKSCLICSILFFLHESLSSITTNPWIKWPDSKAEPILFWARLDVGLLKVYFKRHTNICFFNPTSI